MQLNAYDRRYIIAKQRLVRLTDLELQDLTDEELYDLEVVKGKNNRPISIEDFRAAAAIVDNNEEVVETSTSAPAATTPARQNFVVPEELNDNPFAIAKEAGSQLIGKRERHIPVQTKAG